MTFPEGKVSLSTCSIGIFNKPEDLDEIYSFLRNGHKVELETVGWFWASFLLPQLAEMGFKTVGLHGRTGSWYESDDKLARFYSLVTKYLLMPTPRLIEKASQLRSNGLEYVLLHGYEICQSDVYRKIIARKDRIGTLYVENNLGDYGFITALRKIDQLQEDAVPVGLALDLVHYVDSCKGSLEERWALAMRALNWSLTSYNVPTILHIPIGQSPDSLPMDEMTDDMWRQLTVVLDGHKVRRVIEDQPDIPDQPFITKGKRILQRERAEKNIGRLIATGVI